jgi:RND superfamily putative drug exporter
VVYVEGQGLGGDRAALDRFQRDLAREPGVTAAIGPGTVPADAPGGIGFLVADDGTAARFLAVLDDPPLSPDAVDSVRDLSSRLPALLDGAGIEDATAAIGGYTSLADATVTAVSSDFRRVAALIVLLSLVLIGLFLRSAVGSLLLVAGSGLALLAALGLATWVLQGPLDERGMPYYVPLAAAVLLISLGADYAIFFAGRIWQEARGRGLQGAIGHALDEESDALGTAGLALALSFAALAIIPVDAFRVLGAVMAAGVLLDTLVIRPIAFPAALTLIGPRAGWPAARLEHEETSG